jgi:acetyl esterase/lipase
MPEIRSVSAEGGYHDYPTALGLGNVSNILIQIYQFGAVSAYRLVTGDDVHVLSPISVIDKIAPRPLLLVYGSLEVSLPGARAMLEHAQETGVQADLWVVDGADHGQYLAVAPQEFVRRVVGFHQAALLAHS